MTGALLVLLFVFMVAVSLWSLVDAALQPEQAYARAGISKGLVTGMLVLTCVVGAVLLAVHPAEVASAASLKGSQVSGSGP